MRPEPVNTALGGHPERQNAPDPSMTTSSYDQKLTALLIVDPYNDFMSEGGKLYDVTKPQADAVGFYGNMRNLIPAFRAAGIQVFIVPHHRTRPTNFENWLHIIPTQKDTKRQ